MEIKKYISIYTEDIYGNKALVYHRTKVSDLINKIYTTGFKPGDGEYYGKGFYSTYDLESQLKSDMGDKYGSVIVRFMVNSLKRFFFFDYSEFVKSPVGKKLKSSKDTFIQDQLKYFKVEFNSKLSSTIYSSELAKKLYPLFKTKPVDGIIFTGAQDGKVLVAYNTKLLIPISYSQNDGKTFEKVSPKNMEYLKTVFSQNTDNLDLKVWEGGIWKDGIWKTGTWKTGIWESGTWESGIWKDGLWEDGVWEDGVWEAGTWRNGIWETGTWKTGTWKDGIWENGTWEDGNWQGGTWQNGTWNDGNWQDGFWEAGTWENGTWVTGTWYDGTWENGVWEGGRWVTGLIYDPKKQGNFQHGWKWERDYVRSPISPKEYFGY